MQALKRGLACFALSFLIVISSASLPESKMLAPEQVIVTSFDENGWTWQNSGPKSPESIAGSQPSTYINEVAAGATSDEDTWDNHAYYWYNVSIPPIGQGKVATLSILGGYPPHDSYCTGENCGYWHDVDYPSDDGYFGGNKMSMCSLYPAGPQVGVFFNEIAVGSPFMAVGLNGTNSAYVVEYNGRIDKQTIETIHKRRMGIPVGIINNESSTLAMGAFYAEPGESACNFGQICYEPVWICPHTTAGTALFMRGMPMRTKVILSGNVEVRESPVSPNMRFSVAGYVVSRNNKVIWPESFGATDEKGQVWARFGTGSFGEPMIYVVPSNTSPSWSLFRHNNRSFTFRIGDAVRTGSDVFLLINPEENSPLIITVPSLYLKNYDTSTRDFHVVVGVAQVSSGKYHVAYEQTISVGGQKAQNVTLPDIVIPPNLMQQGEEIVVRALVYTDRGETTVGLDLGGKVQLWEHTCRWHFHAHDMVLARGFNTNRVEEIASSLGFIPPVVQASLAAIASKKYIDTYTHYMRYVGDVAQASIRFIPLSLSVSGSTDVRLSMNIQGAKQFWPNGSSFVVSTDVPLYPLVQFDPHLTVTYVITDITGKQYSGVVAPDLYQVKGTTLVNFSDGVWYFGNRLGNGTIEDQVVSFAPTKSPYTVPLVAWRETDRVSCPKGTTSGICNCIAFNIADCYHALSGGNRIDIEGAIQVRGRVPVNLPDGTTVFVWSPWTPVTDLHWVAYLQQERR